VLHVAHWKYKIKWGKNLLDSNISSTCPHNMVNFGPLTAEIGWPVWGTQQILTGFTSSLRYCSNVAHWKPTKPCTMFGRPGLVHNIYIFGGSCPLTEFCKVQNSLCVQVLHSPILAALLHGTQAAGVSQNLQHATRNGITELHRGRQLYSAGRPSRWASALILVTGIIITPHRSTTP